MNIGAFKAILVGIGRTSRNWRLIGLFYAVNFLFAAVLTLPFATVFAKDIIRSRVGSDLLSGFSYRWYVEFAHANGAFFNSLFPQVIVLLVLYVLVETFLAGGFFVAFSSGNRAKTGSFFSNCGSNFFPLLIVTILEILLLFLLYKGNEIWASRGEDAARTMLTDIQVFHAELFRFAGVAVLFIVINLVSDYVKAAVAIDDDSFMSKVRRGAFFALRHPVSSAGVYLSAAVLSAAVIAMYMFAHSKVHPAGEVGVLLEIAVAQIFILLRIFSKLIFYAGEAAFYKENQIEVISVKLEMLE